MTTALEIITQSMKDVGFLGTGETPQSIDVNDALRKLNWMLAEWAQRRSLVYHLVESTEILSGAQSYTIGPASDIALSVRPGKIDSAVVRQNHSAGTPIDYRLTILQAFEDYQQISSKTLTGPPAVLFLDTAWPVGRLYVWPLGGSEYQLRLLTKAVLTGFTNLTDTVLLPPEYESAINWNLALRLAPMTGEMGVNPVVAAEAKASLRLIMNINAQTRRLGMPAGIPNRGRFNALSGVWN